MRDVYDLGDALLVVKNERPPVGVRRRAADADSDKGRVLTQLSSFWFARTRHLVANHLLDRRLEDVVPADWVERLRDRVHVVRKAKALPVEAVVRGYLAGSGTSTSAAAPSAHGAPLPAGLHARQPSCRKAVFHAVDEAPPRASTTRTSRSPRPSGCSASTSPGRCAISTWRCTASAPTGRSSAASSSPTPNSSFRVARRPVILIDEVMTPDSSRFWPRSSTNRAARHRASTSSTCARLPDRVGGEDSATEQAAGGGGAQNLGEIAKR
ncbi:MAG: phosphoribosylaminoimidazolesuccinocarboxamide synthase [Candidatus Binatia bacterium]